MPEPRNASVLRCTLIVLRWADLDAIVSTLQALGASVRVAPKDSPGGRRAVVLDPDGRSVELS